MQANPEKFQAILVGKKTHSAMTNIGIADVSIPCAENVKLLGIELDYMIGFDVQVTQTCKKAARQLKCSAKISAKIKQIFK